MTILKIGRNGYLQGWSRGAILGGMLVECWWDAHGMLVGCSWGAPGPPGPRSAARSAGAAGAGLPSNAGYLVSRGAIRSSRGCPGVDPGRLPYEARNDPGFDAKHFIHNYRAWTSTALHSRPPRWGARGVLVTSRLTSSLMLTPDKVTSCLRLHLFEILLVGCSLPAGLPAVLC